MDLRSELLKSIWYAFTSLDVEKCGKVSKSQLKVLSHNLYTVLNIPHDHVALEQDFQDDNDGPVSNHGYMPYLQKYILDKVKVDTFNKEELDDLCWMMTMKKNYRCSGDGLKFSKRDSFKLFCLFNLLSEDHYPLVIMPDEVEYLLKKISMAMNQEWDGRPLEELLVQEATVHKGMSVWMFLNYMSAGKLLKVNRMDAFSLALNEVFLEMYHNILKTGYLWKKGHVRRNWTERWFVINPSSMSYYDCEDMKEKKGEIKLDKDCVVEAVPDREGKRCLFCVKTPSKTYEMSASDQKQKAEWTQAIQTALRLQCEGKSSLQQESKLQRRIQRENIQRENIQRENIQRENIQRENIQRERNHSAHSRQSEEPKDEEQEMKKEQQKQKIESIIQQAKEDETWRRKEEKRERDLQKDVQRELERQLDESNKLRESMQAEMVKIEREAKQQRERIQELEFTQKKLEAVLKTEMNARVEEEKARLELEGILHAEEEKLRQYQLLQVQQRFSKNISLNKEVPEEGEMPQESPTAFHCATQELQNLRQTRLRSHQHLEEVQEKLRNASQHVRHWNVQLNRLMKPIAPGDREDHRLPAKVTCPKQEEALASSEFIIKFPQRGNQELLQSQSPKDEEGFEEQSVEFSLSQSEDSQTQTNGQD